MHEKQITTRCRKKLIEALQTGNKAVLAKFAADEAYNSSPPQADGLLNAAQSEFQTGHDPAGETV